MAIGLAPFILGRVGSKAVCSNVFEPGASNLRFRLWLVGLRVCGVVGCSVWGRHKIEGMFFAEASS